MYKLGLEKAEEPEIKLPTFVGSQRKQGNSRKNIYFRFIDYVKAFDCVDHNKLWKILTDVGYQTTLPIFWETCMQAKKQPFEPDMDRWTGSKLGKGYIKAVYCHRAYLYYTWIGCCLVLSNFLWSHGL